MAGALLVRRCLAAGVLTPASHLGGIELVGLVPADRVGPERGDDLGQRIVKPVPRFPAEPRTDAGDVDCIMIVGAVDHPGLDERVLAEHLILDRSEEHTSELKSLMRVSYA